MKLRLIGSLLLIVIMFAVTSSVQAQTYLFSLDEEIVNVYWNSDGTIAADYVFVFTNSNSADPIDFVDVGMPNGNFDWNSISADVNGTPVGLSTDFYGEGGYGFSVDMGAYAIQPGQTGRVHVYVGRITDMVYPDDDEPDTYVSGEYSPTWFGSQYVTGSTSITVVFHLPPGVQPEESRYHPARGGWPCATEPQASHDQEERITYTWACPAANGHSQYTFGLSFPKQYIPAEAIVTSPPAPSFDLGGIISWFFSGLSTWGFICCFGLIFVGAPIMGAVNERKRKLHYMSPKISIEGHGIKRGLTAVESAILMEQPLDKIMTMVLFGVVKKNAATVLTRDPLKLELNPKVTVGLHGYETDFLFAFSKDNLADRRKELQEMTVKLVKSVGDKMKGFSRRETTDYYKAIMERAWQQIETAGTPEVKSQMYDEALEWTMLDKNYDERTRRVFTGPVFVPMWWGRYDPGYRPASVGGATPKISVPGSSGGGRVSVPGSAFAASVVTSVQGFSSRVLGDVKSFTSGVTNRTNPVPKSTSSGGWKGGGGGHSCACACACAGCACACAGGGR
ncbi:MAG: hypothetical protein HY781_04145 [Chloroflexi bacterium]|nr:hypothetical protein [Chloroflexota bacterium]